MENEIRYYLKQILLAMSDEQTPYVPTHIVTAVKLPTGAVEIAVNTSNIKEKIEYILNAYDDGMLLKTNNEIQMKNIMVV